MVASADGAAALAGRSGGLGNDADTALFALMRAQSDVLLVGAGTVRAEGYGGDRPAPRFRTVRRAHGLADAPRIALVSKALSIDPAHPVFTDTEVRPVVVTCAAAPADRLAALSGLADVVVAGVDRVDIAAALDQLRDLGLRRVTCEGGPTLLALVAAADRLDELSLTLAPRLVGGDASRILTGPPIDPIGELRLGRVLEEDGYLYLRYGRVT